MRDLLEKQLSEEQPTLATEVTQIALQFNGAYTTYRRIRKAFYRKRSLDRLHVTACLVAALESKQTGFAKMDGQAGDGQPASGRAAASQRKDSHGAH